LKAGVRGALRAADAAVPRASHALARICDAIEKSVIGTAEIA
jgi:hypothetical protein